MRASRPGLTLAPAGAAIVAIPAVAIKAINTVIFLIGPHFPDRAARHHRDRPRRLPSHCAATEPVTTRDHPRDGTHNPDSRDRGAAATSANRTGLGLGVSPAVI
jgi:hypothetical protein